MPRKDKDRKSERKATVLLVDDNDMVRHVAELMLKELGYDVVPATDGEQALSLFAEDPDRFACVLCDIMMPGMKGTECHTKIRAIRTDVPVVLCSGYSEADLHAWVEGDIPLDFVQKPFDLPTLDKLLEQAMGRVRPIS